MGRYTTLGSLFDGIGGFPLAALKVGIKPEWASEIEKAPISITKRHFPEMRHLGDIKKINGAEIEPVDVITFGSPCQDLSIAGLRAGLDGERSGLFRQALRIVKEMRYAKGNHCPGRIVWENVPGAFSSNKGRDFQTVIEEISKIAEPGISIPRPSQKIGWLAAGAVVGDSWSLAWRVLDAQYWGVPQRRRRIFIVADFGNRCAGEILFKPESGTGDYTEGGEKRDSIAGNVNNSDKQFCIEVGYSSDRVHFNSQAAVTLKSGGGGCGAKTGLYYLPFIRNSFSSYIEGTIGKTLTTSHDIVNGDLIANEYSVRRLTPMECERLQGFPDGWTEYGNDGKRISDNQRYKALGNSVAIPCVVRVLSGLVH